MKLETDVNIDQIFQSVFFVAGSAVIACDCGRRHVCIDSDVFNTNASTEQMRKEYIFQDDDGENENLILYYDVQSLGVININGISFAENCECNGWEFYRNFVFHHRQQIKNFLIEMADQAKLALDEEETFNILKNKRLNVIDDPPF